MSHYCRATAIAVALVALAGCAGPMKRVVSDSDRVQPQGRNLMVFIPQGEIKAEFKPATAGAGFGLIGAIVDTTVNQSRASNAESLVAPVRNALAGFDVDGLAQSTVAQSMASVPWLGAKSTIVSKDMTNDRLNQLLDASTTPQAVFTTVTYSLNPSFSELDVSWSVSILNRDLTEGESKNDRFSNKHQVFNRSFVCAAPATGMDLDASGYASEWSADRGKPAREAISRCMKVLGDLAARNLKTTLAEADAQKQALDTQRDETILTYVGKVIERTPTGTLLVDPSERWVFILVSPTTG